MSTDSSSSTTFSLLLLNSNLEKTIQIQLPPMACTDPATDPCCAVRTELAEAMQSSRNVSLSEVQERQETACKAFCVLARLTATYSGPGKIHCHVAEAQTKKHIFEVLFQYFTLSRMNLSSFFFETRRTSLQAACARTWRNILICLRSR
jgi:hypothetical protein